MTPIERRFAERAVARKRLFLVFSIVGVAVAVGLAVYYAGCRIQDPAYPLRGRGVIVLLILLNARNSLRQVGVGVLDT